MRCEERGFVCRDIHCKFHEVNLQLPPFSVCVFKFCHKANVEEGGGRLSAGNNPRDFVEEVCCGRLGDQVAPTGTPACAF